LSTKLIKFYLSVWDYLIIIQYYKFVKVKIQIDKLHNINYKYLRHRDNASHMTRSNASRPALPKCRFLAKISRIIDSRSLRQG
jgi:hypothetical protein